MAFIYLLFGLVGFYLLVAIPVMLFISVCTLLFALLVAEARGDTRRSVAFLFFLSLIHLTIGYLVLGPLGDNTRPNAFDFFLQIAAVATPVVFLLVLLLPRAPDTDDPRQ